jgi:hypothetical protein
MENGFSQIYKHLFKRRMIMKKFLAYLLLFSFLIFSLFACKPKSDDTPAVAQGPSAPLTLRADAGDGQVTLDWQMVSGASSYNIYMGTSASSLTLLNTSPLPSAPCIVTGLTNGIKYYFALQTVYPDGTMSPLSSTIQALYSTPDKPYPPAAPQNVRASATGETTAAVSWDTNGADAYVVYQYTVLDGWSIVREMTSAECPASTCSYPVDGLTADTKYIFMVTAETVRGKSNEVWATPSAGSPSSGTVSAAADPYGPQNVSVTNVGNGTVTIGWTNPVSANTSTSYNFYCHDYLSGNLVTMITQLYSGPETLSGLTNNTKYSFYLNAVLESSASFVVYVTTSATPPPAAPIITTVTAGDGSVYFDWNDVSGAATYNVYVGTAKGVTKSAYSRVFTEEKPASEFSVSGLTNNAKYYFVVTAVNGNGESTESREFWAIPAAGSGGTSGMILTTSGSVVITAH